MKEVPTFEQLFQLILQDYSGLTDDQGNPIDTSQGSVTAVDSAVLASALQGIYYRARYVEGQALPNLEQSTDETVEGWASIFGLVRLEGESTAELLQRLILRIQQPPAGGNENDWINWAKSVTYDHGDFVESVDEARPVENFRVAGSIDLFLTSYWSEFPEWGAQVYNQCDVVRYDDGNGERIWEALTTTDTAPPTAGPMWELRGGCSSSLVQAVEEYCEEERPLGVWDNQYSQATIVPTDVEMRVDAISDSATAIAELTGYMNSLSISQPFYLAVATAIMVEYGAKVVVVDTPSGDVVPVEGEKIIAGEIAVTIDPSL